MPVEPAPASPAAAPAEPKLTLAMHDGHDDDDDDDDGEEEDDDSDDEHGGSYHDEHEDDDDPLADLDGEDTPPAQS